jgi:hypothetical protein
MLMMYLMSTNLAFGQFTAALNNDHISGVLVRPYNMGNDILDDGTDTYRVHCYTDASVLPHPGITWDVHYSSSNYLGSAQYSLSSLTSPINAYFSDVCLVKDPNGAIHAVTAWYVTTAGGNGWEIEDFQWTGTGFTSNGLTYLGGGTAGTAVNIDADDNGNFIVVFDDYLSNIYAITGNFSASTISVPYAGTPLQLTNPGLYPDVCLYHNSVETLHVTYVDPSTKHLLIDDYDYPTLAGGLVSSTGQPLDANPLYSGYTYPRIACPTSSGAYTDWTVVAQEEDRTPIYDHQYIVGFNNTTGSTPIIYNDGSLITTSTINVSNFYPVVTYDTHSYVWVGWNMDNRSATVSGAARAQYPIVVECDKYSMPTYNSPQTSTSYYEVPTATINTNDNEYLVQG